MVKLVSLPACTLGWPMPEPKQQSTCIEVQIVGRLRIQLTLASLICLLQACEAVNFKSSPST